MQKWLIGYLLLLAGVLGCGDGEKIPDVAGIKVNIELQRFDQDFFALDTNHIREGLSRLEEQYPAFLPDYVQYILGLPYPVEDSHSDSAITLFLRDYRLVKDTAGEIFSNFNAIEDDIKEGLKLTKYYFPDYPLPEKIITFIGPLDAIFETGLGKMGDVITRDALAIGLQLHLGSKATLYQSEIAQSLFPKYVSRKFEPAYIPVNCMKNIIDDIFPPSPSDRTLLDLSIDKGKRLFILDKLLPRTPDTLKIGYTAAQLKGCYANEGLIWSFLLQNKLIYESDPLRIQPYVEEGPVTNELGEGSPGYISLFIGWQIIKKYMEAFPDTTVDQLLHLDAATILKDSKYKPR